MSRSARTSNSEHQSTLGGANGIRAKGDDMASDPTILPFPPSTRNTVLQLLRDAWDFAHRHRVDVREFAVELAELQAAGISTVDLRALLLGGLIERAREVTRSNDTVRRFRKVRSLQLHQRDSFVLTEEGRRVLSRKSNGRASKRTDSAARRRTPNHRRTMRPTWDADLRELRLGSIVLKRFTRTASAQELLLAALQEEHWKPVIDDPLPVRPGADAKRRLRETVKSLNKSQNPRRIQFSVTGDGTKVAWQVVDQNDSTRSR